MYKLFVKIDGYTYRLISEANTREGLVIPKATEFNPWKIEKDGVIVDQGQPGEINTVEVQRKGKKFREELRALLDDRNFQALSIADQADQILALIKQAGYVKLAKDQSCKIQRAGSDEIEDTTFPEVYDDVRRMEL